MDYNDGNWVQTYYNSSIMTLFYEYFIHSSSAFKTMLKFICFTIRHYYFERIDTDCLTFAVNDNMSWETSGEVTILQRTQNSIIALCWGVAHEGKKVAQLIFLNDFYCLKEFLWSERCTDKELKIKVKHKWVYTQ